MNKSKRLRRNVKANTRFSFSLPQKLLMVGAIASLGLAFTVPTASAFNYTNALTYLQQQFMSQRVNDTYKVFSAQDSISNSMLGETVVMAKQRQAAAEAQLNTQQQILDTYNEFANPNALTTNSKCLSLNERENDYAASTKSNLFAKTDLLSMLNIGSYANESDRVQSLWDVRFQLSCTLEQSKAGFCTPSITGGQYYDVDFGLMNNDSRLTENKFASVKLGILGVANPIKDQTVIGNCEGDSACIQKSANQDSRVATTSLVTNSLLSKAYNRVAVGSSYE